MTVEPPTHPAPRDWISVREHLEAMRIADDRRYAEVNIEREKALKIKEEADKVALDLARQIQTYKDEKANELRSQIESERGNYATKSMIIALYGFIVAFGIGVATLVVAFGR